MAERDLKRIDKSDVADWAALAEEVRRSNEPCILRRHDEDIAMLTPVKPRKTVKARRALRGKPFTMEDPLWAIAGIGQSAGPTDVSTNKHKYLR